MQEFTELVFGNRFFQLPFLEALSYVAAVLLIGAIIVSLTRRALRVSSQPSGEMPHYEFGKQPAYREEDTWEWRKAA
jgi:hypothetical protein